MDLGKNAKQKYLMTKMCCKSVDNFYSGLFLLFQLRRKYKFPAKTFTLILANKPFLKHILFLVKYDLTVYNTVGGIYSLSLTNFLILVITISVSKPREMIKEVFSCNQIQII